MEIYQTEKDDGLETAISSSSIAYTTEIVKNILEGDEKALSALAKVMQENIALAKDNAQPDLHYIYSILATLGWNLNDDIFLREEVIAAKNTPVDKPFNRMHHQEDIIGHMTSSRLLDSEYREAADEVFEHIAVNSVIYKSWRDQDKREEILQTIAEIEEGKWKVSMECNFSNFDYGLITADNKQIIIERIPETSYLTKHLRAYGGTGMYKGNKVGRVLRHITFCGKGLVDNPGNPYSIIFNNNKKFFGAVASIDQLMETNMETNTSKAELDTAIAELAKAKADLAASQSALADFKVSLAKEQEEKFTKAISERDTKITALQGDFASTVAKLAEVNEKCTALEAAKLEIITEHEKTVAELTSIKAEKTLADRKTALAGVVAADRVEALLSKVSSYNDEAFATFISTLAEFKPFVKDDKSSDKSSDKKEEKEEKTETKADFTKAEVDKDGIPGTAEAAAQKQKDDLNSVVSFIKTSLTREIKKGDK